MSYLILDKDGNPKDFPTKTIKSIFGIPVSIEKDENNIVITDYIVNMYGVGNDIQSAIEDYKNSIKAYFEELKEEENNLGDDLKQQLNYLRKKLKE